MTITLIILVVDHNLWSINKIEFVFSSVHNYSQLAHLIFIYCNYFILQQIRKLFFPLQCKINSTFTNVRLSIHLSVSLSVTKTPSLHPSSFNLHPSSSNSHPSSSNLHLPSFILHLPTFIIHFATFKLLACFHIIFCFVLTVLCSSVATKL